MDIKTAEFSLSAPVVSMCPEDTKPEYAFIGRSNVGKSSLINMLTNNRKLAKTSATPGKTLLINHFILRIRQAVEDGGGETRPDDSRIYSAARTTGEPVCVGGHPTGAAED